MKQNEQGDRSWDPPLALVCSLNRVSGWRDVWGKPRGKWHREFIPAKWIRISWPSDESDYRLVKEEGAWLARRFGMVSPPAKSVLDKLQEGMDKTPLFHYVDSWLAVQGDWNRWRKENPTLAALLHKAFSAFPMLTQLPGGQMTVNCFNAVPALPGFSFSAATFGRFLLNPGRGFPGKCQRCGRYFLNFGKYERKYCEHRCATYNSAIKHTTQRRKEEHINRLEGARAAIKDIVQNGDAPHNWKDFVAAKVGVKRNWVTRAVRCGELKIGKKFVARQHG